MSALLIWKGERDYLVAHRDIDLIVQGPTIPKAIARFYRVLALEVLVRATSTFGKRRMGSGCEQVCQIDLQLRKTSTIGLEGPIGPMLLP